MLQTIPLVQFKYMSASTNFLNPGSLELTSCPFQQEAHVDVEHERLVNCVKCSQEFTGEVALRSHVAEKHADIFQCRHCKKLFVRERVFRDHLIIKVKKDTTLSSISSALSISFSAGYLEICRPYRKFKLDRCSRRDLNRVSPKLMVDVIPPVANAEIILQACISKSVNTA